MPSPTTEFDPLVDQLPSRFIVGIDLGTTNIAVTYVDTTKSDRNVEVFPIPQVVAPGEIESRETLPSFHFQPIESEESRAAIRLPWHGGSGKKKKSPRYCVGVMARNESANTAGRAIASAKSWLCHAGVDRTAELLPWHGASDIERLSPVEASARYLDHIRRAWNYAHPNDRLEDQEIVITLPASFDEVARTLTVEAASLARLPRITLIEEPQAAFYAWVLRHSEDWSDRVNVGQKILVCDIGGGTTDFTLIRVRESQIEGEKVQFHRVAVGEHLILGGDNLDLALAKHLEAKLVSEGTLSSEQWDILIGRARQLKEDLLGKDGPETVTLKLPGRGSKLIGGGLQTEVTRDEVQTLLLEGFLPKVGLDEKPDRAASGFQEFGLPYAADPAITRYLASFLTAHASAENEAGGHAGDAVVSEDARPDIVLFNGGFFDSPMLRQQVLDSICNWFRTEADPEWEPIVLQNDRLDLAVARGAAYYGLVRRGEGVRITASLARSYYIGVDAGEAENTIQAVCLIPGSAEPGEQFDLERDFQLTLSQPVEFSLLVSSTRLSDVPGDLYEFDPDQMTMLPPIRTVIRAESRNEKRDIRVRLHSELTEIGTIELSCREIDSDRSWKLQFDVRSATQTDVKAHGGEGESEGFISDSTWQSCREKIEAVFATGGASKPSQLVNELTASLGMPREEWPMSLLRRIWEVLFEYEDGRRRSESHESRWINLLGYSLRPGYGFAVDDWRVSETWRHVTGKLAHDAPNIRSATYILWRRLAGGLSRGQQIAMAEPLASQIRLLHRRLTGAKVKTATLRPEESIEIWRLLGSFELLAVERKIELGNMIVDLLAKPSLSKIREVLVWTVGRLGQRTPVYGPLNTVVPAAVVSKWVQPLIADLEPSRVVELAVVQMARRTHDRYRDLDDDTRQSILGWLERNDAGEAHLRLINEGGELDRADQGRVFGESLPRGLRLHV